MTTAALQVSKLGGLVYDGSWYQDGRICETIASCITTPKIPSELVPPAHRDESKVCNKDAAPKPNSPARSPELVTNATNVFSKEFPAMVENAVPINCLEISLVEYQQHWDQLSKEKSNQHRYELESHTSRLLKEAEMRSGMFAKLRNEKTHLHLQHLQEVQKENDELRHQRLRHQQDRHLLHLKKMQDKLQMAKQKKAEEEYEAECVRKNAERKAYLDSMMSVHKQMKESSKKVCVQFDVYKHKDFLPAESKDITSGVQQLVQQADCLVTEANMKGASMFLVESMHAIIEKLMIYQETACKVIADAETHYQEDLAKKASELVQVQVQSSSAVSENEKHTMPKTSLPAKSSKDAQAGDKVLQSATSVEVVEEYKTFQGKHQAVMNSYELLKKTTDPALKKFRFDLQKAVNVPINAISNQSGSHLLDKLNRLKYLLSGKFVNVSERKVSVSNNPHAEAFVKDLLAKKIVQQGDEQVSSNNKSAFPIATVAIMLWSDFPEVGELILAHFYLQCPFLMPYHITKKQTQSIEEYYKSIGYNYESDGTIEKQDKYLRRMSGFMYLYAAIIITQPINSSKQTDPYGIDNAWKWLASLLNVEPMPDITATMLFVFLEVCGHALSVAYSKQFFKLLQIVHKTYFPQIEAVTPKGSGGPVMRLKAFLETCIHTRRINPPKGILQSEFWRT